MESYQRITPVLPRYIELCRIRKEQTQCFHKYIFLLQLVHIHTWPKIVKFYFAAKIRSLQRILLSSEIIDEISIIKRYLASVQLTTLFR